MADEIPTAQGTQEGAAAPTGSQEPSGIEKRINEMHAEIQNERQARSAAEQALLQMTAQMSELSTQVMSMRSQPVTPVIPEPQVEVDPEYAKQIEHVAKRTFGGRMDSIENAIKQTQAMIQQMQGGLTQQKYSRVDPTILTEAQKLAAKGFGSLENCIVYVRGQKALEADEASARANAGRDNMTVRGTNTLAFQSGAPNSTGVNGAIPDLPGNFDQLSTKERIAILRKRGVENKPL